MRIQQSSIIRIEVKRLQVRVVEGLNEERTEEEERRDRGKKKEDLRSRSTEGCVKKFNGLLTNFVTTTTHHHPRKIQQDRSNPVSSINPLFSESRSNGSQVRATFGETIEYSGRIGSNAP